MKRPIAFLMAALLLTSLLPAVPKRIVPQTGHIDAVTKLAVTEDGRNLVSVSRDGTLRVWDRSARNLQYRIQVGPLPLIDVVLHPNATQAAVLESDGISVYRLSVWDWTTGRKYFSTGLEEQPLYLSFSPKGSFLTYSSADWQSMNILSSRTGNQLPYLRDGFGIVSAFRMNSSEQRVVTYLPSGSIQYRNLQTGRIIQEFPTVSGLERMAFTLGNRYIIGQWNDSLIAVDLLSGEDIDSVRVKNLESFAVNEETGEVICYVGSDSDEGEPSYVLYTFGTGGFRTKYSRFRPALNASSNHTAYKGTLYSGAADGALYYQSSYAGIPSIFSENRLLEIHDFDSSQSIIFTATDTIFTIYADYLYQPENGSEQVLTHVQPNPMQAPTKVHSLDNGQYILQDDAGTRGRYWLFSAVEGAIGLPNDRYEAPLTSVDAKNQQILTVDSDGAVQIFDSFTGSLTPISKVYGLQTAIFVHGVNIVTAGRHSQSLRTSKLLIDTNTGETVPLDDMSIETFGLAYDALSHTLYALSLEGNTSNTRTVLTEYTGPIFEKSNVLYTVEGIHTDATMAVSRGALFLTVAGINKTFYAGTHRFVSVDGNNNIPVNVEVMGDWLIGLNKDSSVSIWERANGSLILSFFLFSDLEWVAISKTGAVFSSADRVSGYIKEY